MPPPVTCPTCARSFQPERVRQKFCSRVCARPKLPMLSCPTCGTAFQPQRKERKYCSLPCVPREPFIAAGIAVSRERAAARVPIRGECEEHPGRLYYRPGRITPECKDCRLAKDKARVLAKKLFDLLYPDHVA